MGAGEIAGKILSQMGPGLLSGIGAALQPDKPKDPPPAPDPNKDSTAKPNSFKDGGTVQKTGLALVHKGEKVIPNVSLHRALHHLNKGGLHRALGVKEGEKIPADKLTAAKNSENPHVRKMAEFAHTMEGWKH